MEEVLPLPRAVGYVGSVMDLIGAFVAYLFDKVVVRVFARWEVWIPLLLIVLVLALWALGANLG